ncbi:MAG TPA: hypothetical protein VN960_00135 [Gaiellaceae bacterium]|nr:hypothetical protein [Gaiellaceae bacterium]
MPFIVFEIDAIKRAVNAEEALALKSALSDHAEKLASMEGAGLGHQPRTRLSTLRSAIWTAVDGRRRLGRRATMAPCRADEDTRDVDPPEPLGGFYFRGEIFSRRGDEG